MRPAPLDNKHQQAFERVTGATVRPFGDLSVKSSCIIAEHPNPDAGQLHHPGISRAAEQTDWIARMPRWFQNLCRSQQAVRTAQYVDVARLLCAEANVARVELHGDLSGVAYPRERRILAPWPTSLRGLAVLAHEVGHIVSGHCPHQPLHQREYAAERWAIAALQRHGVAVPSWLVDESRQYVARILRGDLGKGSVVVDPEAAEWAWPHLSPTQHELVREVWADRLPRQPVGAHRPCS